MQRSRWFTVFSEWLGWYGAIFMLEAITTPAVRPSNSAAWGLCVSLPAVPIGAYWLAKHGLRSGTLFIYGCAGALLFVPRFLSMDRFSEWLRYEAPSGPVILLCWIAFALLMGYVCSLAGPQAVGESNPAESGDRPS